MMQKQACFQWEGRFVTHRIGTGKAAQRLNHAFMPDEAAPISNNTLKELS